AALPEIYTLSLHDALPISTHDLRDGLAEMEVVRGDEAAVTHVHELRHDRRGAAAAGHADARLARRAVARLVHRQRLAHGDIQQRSEEHTSELQSRENLVCR